MEKQVLKCAIVDDEPFAIELIFNHLSFFSNIEIIATYSNPLLALAELKGFRDVDLLFLDIDMPEISGIDLAKKLQNDIEHIIFTTAHAQYALQAFGVKAYDYLLKPIESSKLIETVGELMGRKLKVSKSLDLNFFFIKGDVKGKYLKIDLEDIITIYTKNHQVFIATTDEIIHKVNDTMQNVETRLKFDRRFFRVHNSNLINLDKIVKIEGNTIYLWNKWEIPIGESFKRPFLDLINSRLLKIIKRTD